MTGSEMHTMLRRTGIKGTELATQMGFPTASRVYKATNSGSSEVQTIFDMAFERILGKGRFDAILKKIREERIALRTRAAKVVVAKMPQTQPKKRVSRQVVEDNYGNENDCDEDEGESEENASEVEMGIDEQVDY